MEPALQIQHADVKQQVSSLAEKGGYVQPARSKDAEEQYGSRYDLGTHLTDTENLLISKGHHLRARDSNLVSLQIKAH